MRIALVYDLRDDYRALGFSEEEVAEFDNIDTIDQIDGALHALGCEVDRVGRGQVLAKPSRGFSSPFIKPINGSYDLSGLIASDISFMPKNRIPNPIITSPICLTVSFLENILTANPIAIISKA